jgi:hypothetical protein
MMYPASPATKGVGPVEVEHALGLRQFQSGPDLVAVVEREKGYNPVLPDCEDNRED